MIGIGMANWAFLENQSSRGVFLKKNQIFKVNLAEWDMDTWGEEPGLGLGGLRHIHSPLEWEW